MTREGEALRVGNERIDLAQARRVRLVGAGKAAVAMALGACELFGDRVASGSITTRHGLARPVAGLDVWEAGHPIPDTHGLAGAVAALETARSAGPDDLLVCVLSGGASALWPSPPPGVALSDVQRCTEALLLAGAPIGEVNTVRKHLSRLAGGCLARAAWPARSLTLILSDVVGSPLDVIGSGPTVPDPTTFSDALAVIHRRSVDPPQAVLAHLRAGAAGFREETPKPADRVFERASAHIVARNRDALDAAAREAERRGFRARIVDDALQGEACEAARRVVAESLRAQSGLMRDDAPLALFWGGETTVTVRGDGMGGRNQELALAAAAELDGRPGILLAALGTDGIDGPTDAAGGLVDGGTVAKGRAAGHSAAEFLRRNDSHRFLRAAGGLLVTGQTGTNVNDIVLALIAPSP